MIDAIYSYLDERNYHPSRIKNDLVIEIQVEHPNKQVSTVHIRFKASGILRVDAYYLHGNVYEHINLEPFHCHSFKIDLADPAALEQLEQYIQTWTVPQNTLRNSYGYPID